MTYRAARAAAGMDRRGFLARVAGAAASLGLAAAAPEAPPEAGAALPADEIAEVFAFPEALIADSCFDFREAILDEIDPLPFGAIGSFPSGRQLRGLLEPPL